jgi:Kef-type K+ transport system membrane component KefB
VVVGYVVLLVGFAVAAGVALYGFGFGEGERKLPAIGGIYDASARSCLGTPGDPATAGHAFTLTQSGKFVDVGPGPAGGTLPGGELTFDRRNLTGNLTCVDGTTQEVHFVLSNGAMIGSDGQAVAKFAGKPEAVPPTPFSAEESFGRLMLAIAAVILAARLVGAAVARFGQPRVIGEIIAGILLGPSLFGQVAPGIQVKLFPPQIIPLLSGAANIGLAFYLFLVGLEFDARLLRGREAQAAFISNASVLVPLSLGFIVALPVYPILGQGKGFGPFALFMGVALSITAFPVLARILVERRMLRRPTGAIALASAAVDDITAWGLLALATAIAGAGGATGSWALVAPDKCTAVTPATSCAVPHALWVVGITAAFTALMLTFGRRLLSRLSTAYDEAGHLSGGWMAAILLGVLFSAFMAWWAGVAPIFGAFVMGLAMPRRADLTSDITRRIEDFVVSVLLPLFFVVTGLRTHINSINHGVEWGITALLLGAAIVGKWAGAMGAARFVGFGFQESAAIGALMNTRGLTELIVLTIGLDAGVVTPVLFAMLVIMALVTTVMAGPALKLIDPGGKLTSAPEEELVETAEVAPRPEAPAPERSVLVAPQDRKNLEALLVLSEPLALSQPPRELLLVELLPPPRSAAGFAATQRELTAVTEGLKRRGEELSRSSGAAVRTAAFTSPDPGVDIVRIASEQPVDIALLEGRRPLLGGGVPRGPVGVVLTDAPCDVAVLVSRGDAPPEVGPDRPVMVPFGGAEHDWAALELGAWIAHYRGAPLKLLGTLGEPQEGRRDASRLLAETSLVLQQVTGVSAEPLLVPPGRHGVVDAAESAGLLVVGLSERWRQEGLGPVRSAIAKDASSPVLFVRRGHRPGALAPARDSTRFQWSIGATRM